MAKSLPGVLGKRIPEAQPLAEAAMRLARRSTSSVYYNEAEGQRFLATLKKQRWGVFPIIGLQGGGKTVAAIWLAEYFDQPVYTMGMYDYQTLPHYVKVPGTDITQILRLPHGSTVILDDISQISSIYSYYERVQGQGMIDLVTQCRHNGLTIIATGQNTRAINNHLFDTLETLFFKVPPISAQLERPAVRRAFPQIQAAFYGKSEAWQRSHLYVWSTRYMGIIGYRAEELVKQYHL